MNQVKRFGSHMVVIREEIDTFGDLSAWNVVFLLRCYNRKPWAGAYFSLLEAEETMIKVLESFFLVKVSFYFWSFYLVLFFLQEAQNSENEQVPRCILYFSKYIA